MTATTFRPRVESFAHQTEGVKQLIKHDGVYALLWEPGTGKTKCVIDYLSWLALAARSEVRVLVVCPKAVTDSWVDQMALHCAVSHREDVLEGSINEKAETLKLWAKAPLASMPMITLQVINVETMSSRRTVTKTTSKLHSDHLLQAVKKYAPHVLVVDESHRLKSSSSNAGRLLQRISRVVKRRILLTGTPMPHGPMDVWTQWQILDPTAFATGGKSWPFSKFQQYYAVMGGYMGKEIMGYHHLDDLQRRMGACSMVVRKEDALDLPPTMEIVHKFAMEPAEERAYRKMLDDLLVLLDSGAVMSAPSRLTQMLRLRQIVSGYVRADGATAYKYIGEGRLHATLELLQDLCATEHRLVVFAWGRPEVDRLVERINSAKNLNGFVAHAITGDTSDAERMRLRKKFAETDDPNRLILVCQWRTVSLGINEFVSASHAIFLSLSQQRDDLIQGKARLDRQGQTKPVTFHYVECPGTIDSVIRKSHTDRTDLESAILSHIRGGSK